MTYEQFKAICDANHVHITFNDEENAIAIDCAAGEVMVGSGLHYRDVYLTGGPPLVVVYADLADDLAQGVETCEVWLGREGLTPGGCEICAANGT